MQEQLGSVAANRETRVVCPDGWALLASLEYREHLGRAACGRSADRRDELLAAVAAAHRAVGLYREQFDYHSMVIMQFDAAAARHRLGERAAALAALEDALRMDREYGFRSDAQENYRLLLGWRGEAAGTADVARLMQNFPERCATLPFGWYPSDAKITLERDRASLDGGQIARSRAVAVFERRIGAAPAGGWSVSFAHRLSGCEPGVWPSEPGVWPSEPGPHAPQLVFPPAALPAVDFQVSARGEFEGVTDSKGCATRWYVSLGHRVADTILESEQLLSTTAYGRHHDRP